MLARLSPLRTAACCLFAFISLIAISSVAQSCPVSSSNVTTWHNDNNRTGWQCNETTLTPSNVSSNFGLLATWKTGSAAVFAQPLALNNVPSVSGCSSPCNLVIFADEQDNLYAYSTAPPFAEMWSLNLASSTGIANASCEQ